MKKILSITLLGIITLQNASIFAQHSETQKTESQNSNQSSKVSSATIFANALLLAEIYRKIEKISKSGNEDKSQLTPILEQLNSGLDQVLSFKDSFTPSKRQRIEGQLTTLKGKIQSMAQLQNKELKKSSLELASGLLDLVDVLLDRSKPETKPSKL